MLLYVSIYTYRYLHGIFAQESDGVKLRLRTRYLMRPM